MTAMVLLSAFAIPFGVAIRDIQRLGSSSEARKLLNLMVSKMDAMDIIYMGIFIYIYMGV